MSKLYAIMITKNDHRIIHAWLKRHAAIFDAISVVDGSEGNATEVICRKFPRVVYRRDPNGLITDQTLRHAAMASLRPVLSPNDWIFIAHPDEFLYHNPRDFLGVPMPLLLWLPLLVLPHPSERLALESLGDQAFDPPSLLRHYWWRTGQLPHCEFRMFRWVMPDHWDIETPKRSTSVIPPNYAKLSVCNLLPIYFHYKIYDINEKNYTVDGKFVSSGLDTGIDRPFKEIGDLFFDQTKTWGDGYIHFDDSTLRIGSRFGTPPRSVAGSDGKLIVVNDRGEKIH